MSEKLQLMSCNYCNTKFNIYFTGSGTYWWISGKENDIAYITLFYKDGNQLKSKFIKMTLNDIPQCISYEENLMIYKMMITHNKTNYFIKDYELTLEKQMKKRTKKHRLVITCGSFDGLHNNHQRLLKFCYSLGDCIIYYDKGDIKHSGAKYMFTEEERGDAIKMYLFHRSSKRKLNVDKLCMVKPRTKTNIINQLMEIYEEYKDDYIDIYYVCGSDQGSYLKKKLAAKNCSIKVYMLNRMPINRKIGKVFTKPKIIDELNLAVSFNKKSINNFWGSSSDLRFFTRNNRLLNNLNIDKENNNINPSLIPDRSIYDVGTKYYIRVDGHGKPLKLNSDRLNSLAESDICIILPGRSARIHSDTICGEFNKISQACAIWGNIVNVICIKYHNTNTSSDFYLKKLYQITANEALIDKLDYETFKDAYNVFSKIIIPRINKNIVIRFRNNKIYFIGFKFSNDINKRKKEMRNIGDRFRTLTFIARSYGTVICHILSILTKKYLLDFGLDDKEASKLCKEIRSIDIGNIVFNEINISNFYHVKFTHLEDKKAWEKLSIRLEYLTKNKQKQVTDSNTNYYHTIAPINAIINTKTCKKELLKLKVSNEDWRYHKSIAYIGDNSRSPSLKFIMNKIEDAFSRSHKI